MKKVIWKRLKCILAVGETVGNAEINLDSGERLLVAATTNRDPGQLVSLGLFENSTEVSAPMDISFWRKSNAGLFLDGFKPVSYKGGATIRMELTTDTAIAGSDLQVEMVFATIKEDTTC